jgi:biopolymer transport protein ExbB
MDRLKFALWIALGIITFSMVGPWSSVAYAQETAAAAVGSESGTTTEVVKSENIWHTIKEGGLIMIPLAGISMWCTALFIECIMKIRLIKFAPPDVVQMLRAAFMEENYQQAWRICRSRNTFLTNTLRFGLERIGRGRIASETALTEHAMKESMIYRTKVSYLSTIGVVSPMVGLLGTVTGMVEAFKTLGSGGIGDPSLLAAAIGKVLIATATGLLIAIPAFFIYYYFRNKLQMVVVLAEDVMNQLMLDVKYEELHGIKIGDSLESELSGGGIAPYGAGGVQAGGGIAPGRRVSQAIRGVSVACPQCNAAITTGSPRCNACGTELQWT